MNTHDAIENAPKEDVWIHTACCQCLGECGVVVRRVDGVVREIQGDPDCPASNGKICPKGQAGIMKLYDKNRVLFPMKRTNKNKGLGVDPGWRQVSWEEAMDTLTEKIGEVRKRDPRRLVISSFDTYALCHWLPEWAQAFGTPNLWIVYFCGQYLHSSMYLTNGTFHCDFDAKYCNYLILVGNQAGFGSGLNPNISIQAVAAARKRGMKIVAIDPVCNQAGSKADEWVPIRPGTDAGLMLGMANVLVNELGLYDREFLKKHSNSPYLVGADGLFLRRDGKPLVFDLSDNTAKVHDEECVDPAMEGQFAVEGQKCRPAFELLKEHLAKHTPESVSAITTVPADTIRRLAKEFGEAARIGSTITIDSVSLPYRPVAVNIYRGAGAHKHGVGVALLTQLLNLLVGAVYVPGGHRGINAVGPRPDREAPPPAEGVPNWEWNLGDYEGLASPTPTLPRAPNYYTYQAKAPTTVTLKELFPLSSTRAAHAVLANVDPGAYGLDYKGEVLLVCRRNLFRGGADYEATAKGVRSFDFVAVFATHFDEVADFADLLLPEVVGYEKMEVFPNLLNWGHAGQGGYWYWGLRQPVVSKPMGEARHWHDVMMDVAERLGMMKDLYERFNGSKAISDSLGKEYKLDLTRKYSNEEMADLRIKSRFGKDRGLEYFKKNGYTAFKRTVDENYPLPWLKVRFPIYHEVYIRARRDMEKVVKDLRLKNWDLEDYVPLPEWKPCASYNRDGKFDLIAVNFRVPTEAQSITSHNVWLAEVSKANPYSTKILINTATAAARGVRDNDRVVVESPTGKVRGIAKVTECIHPEALGISSHFGGLLKGKAIGGQEERTQYNQLLALDMDPVSTGVDSCVKVAIRRA